MIQLQLDGPSVHTTYYGKNNELMPRLLAEGKEPMSIAHLMEQRIKVGQEGIIPEQHDAWWNNYFDCADLWLRHPDKGGKVVPYNAQVLDFLKQHLNSKTRLVDYAIPLPDGFFEAADGLELKTAEIERLNSKGYTSTSAKNSEVWKTLALTSERLSSYVKAVVAETGSKHDLMNLYFGSASAVPAGRLWYVGSGLNYSNARSNNGLTSSNGRLVGVTPEAHVARAKK